MTQSTNYEQYLDRMKTFRQRGVEIPEHLRHPLAGYLANRWPLGDFLQAVIANDLRRACAKADDESLAALAVLCCFLKNEAPEEAYGSKDAYREWHAQIVPPEPEEPPVDRFKYRRELDEDRRLCGAASGRAVTP